ncbi:MAG: DUF1150 family protein [Alphaproteobacteria bacterium]|nr:DUF1150 family protein [Alphaproteobacteria bacterium]
MKTSSHSPGRHHLSPEKFAVLGLNQLAYVKPITVDGRLVFAIHGADGSELAVFEDRETAFVAARRNDFEAVSVH